MFNEEQKKLMSALAGQANRDQAIWLSGYFQGVADGNTKVQAPALVQNKPRVAVYYATETGNAKGLSLSLLGALKSAGYKTKSASVNRLKPEDFKKDEIAIFIASTHGEGTPPESAERFFGLMEKAADSILDSLKYAVLGLGDSTYEIYCGAATTLDENLSRIGGSAFQEIALFDVDYASHSPKWIADTVAKLDSQFGENSSVSTTNAGTLATVQSGKGYSRLSPIKGRVKDIINLNDLGSNKSTFHIELEHEDSIVYTPGDAAGIVLPDEVADGDLKSRLYSIASSPSLHEGEIHLTVALSTFVDEEGNSGEGLVSGYLSKLKEGDVIDFFISQNQMFNLPEGKRDAIMIGPGTGIAPFRSFVYERSDRGATGRNWVFFGDQHAHCDFLYQSEWQEHLATGALSKLDLAFSRDKEFKVYVQDRLLENADELVSWLDNGAAIFVCGAKEPMSKDVEKCLFEIIAEKKSLNEEEAQDYFAELEEQGRYSKDVY